MTPLDRYLQRWRMLRAAEHILPGSCVIDVGAHNGEFFSLLGPALQTGFGVEPLLAAPVYGSNWEIQPGYFPQVMPRRNERWDAITMLAVLEHVSPNEQANLVTACADLLRDGGRVILTVPSPAVDHILSLLQTLRLIDGMSLEQHFGFDPQDTKTLFRPPAFRLCGHLRFQLGLNHLFIFERQRAS